MTVFSRASSKATFPAGIRVVKTDHTLSSLAQAFKDAEADAVDSTVTMTAIGEQTRIVDAAVEAGVKRFVSSDFGLDIANPAVLKAVPILGGKTQVIDHLRKEEKKGLSWTPIFTRAYVDLSVPPSWPLSQVRAEFCHTFLRSGLSTGFLGFDVAGCKATVFDEGDVHATFTAYATVANSVVGDLSRPSETSNRFIHVQSIVATQNEILAALEKATGESLVVTHKPLTDMRDFGFAAFKAGGGPEFMNLIP